MNKWYILYFGVLIFSLFIFMVITMVDFSIPILAWETKESFETQLLNIPIKVHTTTSLENVKTGFLGLESAFFNNTDIESKSRNIKWVVDGSANPVINTDFSFDGTGLATDAYIKYLQNRNTVDGLDLTLTLHPHLFIVNTLPGLPIIFSQLSPPIIVYTGTVDSTGFPNDMKIRITQELCKILGLVIDDTLANGNIMKTSPTGFDTNWAQDVLLYKQADAISVNTGGDTLNVSDVVKKADESETQYKEHYYDNIQYHETEQEIRDRTSGPGEGTGTAYVKDASGNVVALGKVSTQPDQLYYTAGSFPFGSAGYVPKYDDAVYLSKLTGETTATLLEGTPAMNGGFCTQEANNPLILDEKCRATNKNQCASTTCCVLLGGAKCVAGNDHGPTMTAHYSDFTIANRDYYYYQGKCFGNCPGSSPF